MDISYGIVLISILIAFVNCYSQPVIENTRKEGCLDDGRCGAHCEFDGVKLFPDSVVEQKGKCRFLRCNDKFQVLLTECPFDMFGKFDWVKQPGDELKTYPFCCGTKTRRTLQPITRATTTQLPTSTKSFEKSKDVTTTTEKTATKSNLVEQSITTTASTTTTATTTLKPTTPKDKKN